MNCKQVSFTPTERRILEVLADGHAHPREQLLTCLLDDQARPSMLQRHISNLRQKLSAKQETIICELRAGTIHYRRIRHIAFDSDKAD